MRIRSVKPEFWRDRPDVAALSREFRLLLIALSSYVDDNGVGVDDARLITADVFPFDDDPKETREYVSEGLRVLAGASLLVRYEAEGRRLLYVSRWSHDQRVDHPNASRFPLPPGGGDPPTSDDAEGRRSLARDTRQVRESLIVGNGDGDRETSLDPQMETGDASLSHLPSADPNASTSENPEGRHSLARDARETRARNRGTEEKKRLAPRAGSDTELPGFAEFYDAYPRKRERKKAAAAYRSALKAGVKPERLLTAAQTYARSCEGKEINYVKYPASWLNAGAYDDEPERHLQPVRDTRPPTEIVRDLWQRGDGPAAARLLRKPYLPRPQPPDDRTDGRVWARDRAREFITTHKDGLIAALTAREATA